MRPIVYPYRMHSESARALARELGCRRVWPDRNYRPRPDHLIINWGNSGEPEWDLNIPHCMNWPEAVALAANKRFTFEKLAEAGVSTPRFTTDANEAYGWDTKVMARQTVTSHSGRGCHYLEGEGRELLLGSLNNCPLYTEYVGKVKEIRVHVCRQDTALGKVLTTIDYAEKKLRSGSTGNNFQIRSHGNGWIFCREGVIHSPRAQVLAVEAIDALGLDFGAVDIIYNSHRNEYYVLEVNTAPGLQGTTLTNYVNAIRSNLS